MNHQGATRDSLENDAGAVYEIDELNDIVNYDETAGQEDQFQRPEPLAAVAPLSASNSSGDDAATTNHQANHYQPQVAALSAPIIFLYNSTDRSIMLVDSSGSVYRYPYIVDCNFLVYQTHACANLRFAIWVNDLEFNRGVPQHEYDVRRYTELMHALAPYMPSRGAPLSFPPQPHNQVMLYPYRDNNLIFVNLLPNPDFNKLIALLTEFGFFQWAFVSTPVEVLYKEGYRQIPEFPARTQPGFISDNIPSTQEYELSDALQLVETPDNVRAHSDNDIPAQLLGPSNGNGSTGRRPGSRFLHETQRGEQANLLSMPSMSLASGSHSQEHSELPGETTLFGSVTQVRSTTKLINSRPELVFDGVRVTLYPSLQSPFVMRLKRHFPGPFSTFFGWLKPHDSWQLVLDWLFATLTLNPHGLSKKNDEELAKLLEMYCTERLYRIERKAHNHQPGIESISCVVSGCSEVFGPNNAARNIFHHITKAHWVIAPFNCSDKDCDEPFRLHNDRLRHEKLFHKIVHRPLRKPNVTSPKKK